MSECEFDNKDCDYFRKGSKCILSHREKYSKTTVCINIAELRKKDSIKFVTDQIIVLDLDQKEMNQIMDFCHLRIKKLNSIDTKNDDWVDKHILNKG